MFDALGDKRRNVVPRWRPIDATPSRELVFENKYPNFKPILSSDYDAFVKAWRRDDSLEAASDLLDLGIASGDRTIALEASRRVLAQRDRAVPALARAAERVLDDPTRLMVQVPIAVSRGEDSPSLRSSIVRYKRRVSDAPRDALGHVELARCYSRLGSFEKAQQHMFVALQLEPNDRFVLRAAARFYTMRDDPTTALKALRSSDGISADPWIQSAEVAVSELFDKGSRAAKQAVREIRHARKIERNRSELALAIATLEQKNGLRTREVLKIIDAALADPTENALAQGVWLTDQAGREFHTRFPTVKFPEDAHEAKSIDLDDRGFLQQSEREGLSWFRDQPFQVRAALHVGNLNLIHLHNYKKASIISGAALNLHPDDWHLINCSALSDILAGQLREANAKVVLFEKRSVTEEMRAFSSAARGMLLFQEGRVEEGRAAYQRAIDHCKKARKYDLIPNAVIYWLEREAVARTVGSADIQEVERVLKKVMPRLPSEERKDLMRVWESRKRVIDLAMSDQVKTQVESARSVYQSMAHTLQEALPSV